MRREERLGVPGGFVEGTTRRVVVIIKPLGRRSRVLRVVVVDRRRRTAAAASRPRTAARARFVNRSHVGEGRGGRGRRAATSGRRSGRAATRIGSSSPKSDADEDRRRLGGGLPTGARMFAVFGVLEERPSTSDRRSSILVSLEARPQFGVFSQRVDQRSGRHFQMAAVCSCSMERCSAGPETDEVRMMAITNLLFREWFIPGRTP